MNGIILLLDSTEHRPVNLGNPHELTVLELADRVAEVAGRPRAGVELLPLPVDDPRQRCPDIARARDVLGWEPVTPLDEGLRRTLEWFRQARQHPVAG